MLVPLSGSPTASYVSSVIVSLASPLKASVLLPESVTTQQQQHHNNHNTPTTPPPDGSHGYRASKWVSERFLERVHARCGLPGRPIPEGASSIVDPQSKI